MKEKLSKPLQTEIKEVIEVILHEIELQNIKPMHDISFVMVSNKKFRYAEDLGKIIEKINEGENSRVIRVVSHNDLDKIDTLFKVNTENLIKLQKVRSMFDFGFGFEQAEQFYFLVEDLERLKGIETEINKILESNKNITLQINENMQEVILKNNKKFKHSFRKTRGTNKRFNYLVRIYNNPKISGHNLSKGTSLQNISKEIKIINNTLKDKLKLLDELIINNESSGYEINSKYVIEFI